MKLPDWHYHELSQMHVHGIRLNDGCEVCKSAFENLPDTVKSVDILSTSIPDDIVVEHARRILFGPSSVPAVEPFIDLKTEYEVFLEPFTEIELQSEEQKQNRDSVLRMERVKRLFQERVKELEVLPSRAGTVWTDGEYVSESAPEEVRKLSKRKKKKPVPVEQMALGEAVNKKPGDTAE